MEEVKRDNTSEKLMGLLNELGILFVEMEYLTYLKTLKVNFTAKRLSQLQDISTFIAILINVIMVYAYSRVLVQNET
jgi:hypothetical protein